MKPYMIAAVLAAAISTSALAADVGVSISIGEPGFYGRIDIGDFPHPQVIYRQPIIVDRVPVTRPPIYLRVPPGHAKHWSKHCHEYNACGEQVYFVHDDWYRLEYVPRYKERHRDGRGDRRDERWKDNNNRGGKERGHGHDR